MNTLKELVIKQKKALGLTNLTLSKMSGVNLSTVSNISSGHTTNPGFETVRALAEVLCLDMGDFNRETPKPHIQEQSIIAEPFSLLDEHGKRVICLLMQEELHRLNKDSKQLRDFLSPKNSEKTTTATVMIYDEPAAAGSGNYAEGDLSHEEEFLASQVPDGTDFAVKISGESMAPTIPDGCIAFIQGAPVINSDEYGVFMLDGQAYCKQLKMIGGKVVLHSLNPAYPDVDVPTFAEFRTIGKILGYFDDAKNMTHRFKTKMTATLD